MKILVLGYGRVGKAIVDDLCKQGHEVWVMDNGPEAQMLSNTIDRPYHLILFDATSPLTLAQYSDDKDLVVNALPGRFGYEVTKGIIELRRNIVDISFFPEEAGPLRELAKEKGVIAAIDCGLAPGIWNMILAHAENEMNTESCICYVGGLPKHPEPPFFYKAPYNPHDVLEMYTRKSRYLKDGITITKQALTDMEVIDFDGTLVEAFNTDGLRTMLTGMKTPTIIEKTLRWPGTADMMHLFKDLGFFSNKEHKNGIPVDLFAELVFPYWQYRPGEKDITLMMISITGQKNGKFVQKKFKLYDEAKDFSSMARTTGYVATAVVDLIDKKVVEEPGLYAPEDIGRIACLDVVNYLRGRNVVFKTQEL